MRKAEMIKNYKQAKAVRESLEYNEAKILVFTVDQNGIHSVDELFDDVMKNEIEKMIVRDMVGIEAECEEQIYSEYFAM